MKRKIGWTFLLITVGAALLYGALAWRAAPVAAHPWFEAAGKGPLVIAHQGGNLLRPDNTLVAFQHAVDLGVDVLEMDVSQTADGHIVVMHDLTVDRTTNGRGPIIDLNLEQLKQLDAAYHWTADEGATFPYRGQGITVPTLIEVFEAFPTLQFNVEIKQKSPSMVAPFCRLLRDAGVTDRVLVASFHPETMTEFRQVCPEVATSAVEPEIRLFFGLNTARLGAVFDPPAEAFQVPEFSGGLHVVTDRFVRGAHAHHVDVHVWTVNEPEAMRRLIALGVDGLITDRPDLLLEILDRR